MGKRKNVDLYGVSVPAKDSDPIETIAAVLYARTFVNGKYGKKESVIYAQQMIEDWTKRVIEAEGRNSHVRDTRTI